MNAEYETIPSVQFVWDREAHRFIFKSMVLQVVDHILKMNEWPCDPKLKQERADQRISIK